MNIASFWFDYKKFNQETNWSDPARFQQYYLGWDALHYYYREQAIHGK